MHVNLARLEEYGRVSVYCATEEYAKMFMDAMWEQHPEKMEGVWSRTQTNWRGNQNGIYYLPRIFHKVDLSDEYGHCQSSTRDWSLSHGYTIVPFEVLLETPDLGVFDTSEVDIKSLLDMG